MGQLVSKPALQRAHDEVMKVLAACVPAYEIGQLELLREEEEEHIRREVERWLFEPDLPNGGEKERKIVERLKRMARTEYWEASEAGVNWADGTGSEEGKKTRKNLSWLAIRASEAVPLWVAVLARCNCNGLGCPQCWDKAGRYYFQHPVTPKTDKLRFSFLNELKSVANVVKDWEAKWFAELMLAGPPEGVSDFQVQPLFGVRRYDGSVQRCLRLRNILGEGSKVLTLEAENFGSPEKFRIWCLKQGPFSFRGNQTHLQMIHEDTNRQIAHRFMEDVDACGWRAVKRRLDDGRETEFADTATVLSGAWFYDECAYYNGVMVKPDDDGIFFLEGCAPNGRQGFYFQERGRESEYELGRPKMRPDVKLLELPLEYEEWLNPPKFPKDLKPGDDPRREAAVLRAYFREVCHRMYETIGSQEAYIAIGAVFAYAAAPEIFAQHGLFPGLFVHGQMGSGKSQLTEWLIHLQGFEVSKGISIIEGSTVGIVQGFQNYSNLALWLDEFRNDPRAVDEHKVGVLRDAFNRLARVKWSPDGRQRKMGTAPIVSGESTSSDTATRSRYPHVQVSEEKRIGEHITWFTPQKKNLFVFWRHVMEHRAEFVTRMLGNLDEWINAPSLADLKQRQKIVHGISWAAWTSLAELVGSHTAQEHGEFMQFAIAHMRAASVDIISETNVNMFWQLLVTAFEEDAIPLEYFRMEAVLANYPEGVPWTSYRLWLQIDAIISALQAYLVKRHETMPLKRRDLLHQSSRAEWWLLPTNKRFGKEGSKASMAAWGLDVDKHPLGRQDVTAEQLQEAALTASEKTLGDVGLIFRDSDPRKGPLFRIIEALEEQEKAASHYAPR